MDLRWWVVFIVGACTLAAVVVAALLAPMAKITRCCGRWHTSTGSPGCPNTFAWHVSILVNADHVRTAAHGVRHSTADYLTTGRILLGQP